jgi:hypothetical protein
VETQALVRDHLDCFEALVRAVLDGPPEDFHGDLERLLERWETDRPAAVADGVLLKEIDYVRRH